jgi:opacity protein-like surface antigen
MISACSGWKAEVGFRRAWTDQCSMYTYWCTAARAATFVRLSFMLNGCWISDPDDGLQGFVGGGAGVARTHLYSLTTDDSDTGFAWQALAGVRMPLSSHLDAELKYRFFNHRSLDLVTSNQRSVAPVLPLVRPVMRMCVRTACW